MLAVSCVDVSLHGGNVILSSSGFPLLTAAAKEQGILLWQPLIWGISERFVRKTHPFLILCLPVSWAKTGLTVWQSWCTAAILIDTGSVQTLIDTGDVDKLPNLFLYMAVTGIYLVLLGPGPVSVFEKLGSADLLSAGRAGSFAGICRYYLYDGYFHQIPFYIFYLCIDP